MCETFRWPTGRSSAARCAPRWRGGRDRVVAALRDCGDHGAEGGSPPKGRGGVSPGPSKLPPSPRHSPSQRKKRNIPIPGHGHFPAQRSLAAGRPSPADGPSVIRARRLGVRAGGCSHVRALAPRPGPLRAALRGHRGLLALAPPARAGTGAGPWVREEKARRQGATASWNTFPCLERKPTGERGKKK